jgi:hypothetical protein
MQWLDIGGENGSLLPLEQKLAWALERIAL